MLVSCKLCEFDFFVCSSSDVKIENAIDFTDEKLTTFLESVEVKVISKIFFHQR